MPYHIQKLNKELLKTKNRRLKKRILRKKFIIQLNLLNRIQYNLFIYFLSRNHLILNRKVLAQIYSEEFFSIYSLKK